METTDVTLCEYCLERGLDPGEAVGIYLKRPICDPCLGVIMDNKSDGPDTTKVSDEELLAERKVRALALLDQFEELFDNWPLTADETLLSHSDFYNHKPPAIVNCSLEQIQAIYSRRKGILYAIRHKDERWYTEIEQLRRTARKQANLTGIAKSVKERNKAPSQVSIDAKKKLAKTLGITIAQLDAMGKQSREEEFKQIVGSTPIDPARQPVRGDSARAELTKLQNTVKGKMISGVKRNPITGKIIS